eukprot:4806753-Pyramimonas_sp.AAC.1
MGSAPQIRRISSTSRSIRSIFSVSPGPYIRPNQHINISRVSSQSWTPHTSSRSNLSRPRASGVGRVPPRALSYAGAGAKSHSRAVARARRFGRARRIQRRARTLQRGVQVPQQDLRSGWVGHVLQGRAPRHRRPLGRPALGCRRQLRGEVLGGRAPLLPAPHHAAAAAARRRQPALRTARRRLQSVGCLRSAGGWWVAAPTLFFFCGWCCWLGGNPGGLLWLAGPATLRAVLCDTRFLSISSTTRRRWESDKH